MAPSLLSLGTAALALAGNGAAVQWYLEDTYNSTNFFDKFDFMTFDDPNSGYVNYLGRTEAIDAGLAAVQDKEVILKVDSKTTIAKGAKIRGRDSVRLESKARLNQGLMIARFTHLPQSACGTWPAFWTVGDTWPQDGEIDIIENWNLRGVNNPAFHMANTAAYGSCRIDSADQSGGLITPNCDNQYTDYSTQWLNQGCVVEDNGPSGGSGGVYAMEWTSDFIKIYSWFPNQVPSNIGSSSPDTSSWGAPTMYLRKDLCNIDKIFKPQRIVLNIAMCGNPVEFSAWEGTCKNTHGDSCRDYVGQNPDAFKDVYFKVQDIRIFNQDAPKTTSTSTTATTMASSSASKSEISTTSATPSTEASSTSKSEISTASATSKSEISTASATPSTEASSTSKSVKNTSTWKSSNSTMSTVSKSAGSVSVSIASKASDSTVPTVSTQVPVTFSTSVPSLSTRWPNSTIASSVEMTTSTVYTTSTRTITSCQPTVTSCSVGKVTTVTLPLYITICPVSAVETKTPAPKPTKTSANGGNGGNGPEKTTITTKVTKTYTITSCAPTITNCPVGKVTTEVFTTTYCPGEETAVPTGSNGGNNPNGGNGLDKTTITTKVTKTYTITSCAPTITNCPVGKVTTEVFTTTYCPGEETAVPTGSNGGNNPNGGNGGNNPNGGNSGNNPNGGNGGNNGNGGNGGNNGNGSQNGGNNGNGGKGPDKITITTKVTKTYTITSCAPGVTNCPVGKVTTEVVPTTYYPGKETHPAEATGPKGGFTAPPPFHPSKTTIYNTQTIVSVPQPAKPSGGNNNNSTTNGTSIAQPQPGPSGSQVCVGPSCGAQPSSPAPNTDNGGCTGPNCPPTVVSGAAKQSLSALVVLGAVAAMML
ncbi:hypothetical protein H634G_00051 [Metarhizium anisopliae BRIP 53293]|uniref:GH16 domain-containing protein n=1 Tax=Metarhizium anisopliae BRIP 53293 TaxID=1291518 RepID=A0A0D9PI97_METAN|nr:hypothetical protein H634G_00051 [Metarhizium anisopliae BRIP 53293]